MRRGKVMKKEQVKEKKVKKEEDWKPEELAYKIKEKVRFLEQAFMAMECAYYSDDQTLELSGVFLSGAVKILNELSNDTTLLAEETCWSEQK
jgi:hypothetical protein